VAQSKAKAVAGRMLAVSTSGQLHAWLVRWVPVGAPGCPSFRRLLPTVHHTLHHTGPQQWKPANP
jgi:hypothetical protein